MSTIGKIIRVNALPPVGERQTNVIYQVAAPGATTYTDYAIDENGDLKTHAVVDGSIPLELTDNHITVTNPELVAEGLTHQAIYNTDTREKLSNKLDKPTADGNADNFPKIIGMNDNGNVAKLPAGDLGKNIANSSLTSVAGAGLTLGADWTMDTSGLNYSVAGLADVSNNSTFNTFLAQNSTGRLGKSTGKQVFLTVPTSLTEAERTAWKTAMNGGWTTNTMSVALITPPVVDKQNKNYWLTLRGANLNLNPASFSVEIMDQDGSTKITTVPNSQVQLYTTGLDLTFYYNFKDLPTGQYKIRLWNGVAYYVTSITIGVVTTLDNINLSALTWETKLFTPNTPNVVTVSGGTMSYTASAVNKPFARENVVVAALKSSEIAAAGQNFSLSGTLRLRDAFNSLMNIVFGVMDKSNTLALSNNATFQISINCNNIANNSKSIKGDTLFSFSNQNEVDSIISWSISRNGNLFTVLLQYGSNVYFNTKVGIQEALSLVSYINNTTNNDNIGADASFNIQSAYRF